MHVGSLAPSTSHPPFLFAGEALHPPLLSALTFAPHLFFAGLALHPPSALRPQLCTPPLFCGLSSAGIKGFPKLKSLNAYFFLQKSVPIQPKTSNILPKFCQKLATTLRVRMCDVGRLDAARGLRELPRGRRGPRGPPLRLRLCFF